MLEGCENVLQKLTFLQHFSEHPLFKTIVVDATKALDEVKSGKVDLVLKLAEI